MLNNRRRIVAIAIAAACSALPAQAVTLSEIFDGVNSNASSGGAFQGQTMNIYTGGSLFMRVPRKTYNLASLTPLSASAGCGGIDFFAGSFSHINKEQFVAMLRNIGQNAVGYAFKLAVQNLCAPCDNIMQALEATARAMNSLNIDSCEAAKGIVNVMSPSDWKGKSETSLAKTFGPAMNLYDDAMAAWDKVGKDEGKRSETLNQAKTNIPGAKDKLPSGNLTWKALKSLPGLDDESRQLIMSIVGTVVFYDAPTAPEYRTGGRVSLDNLIGKPFQTSADITGYRCLDGTGEDQCLSMDVRPYPAQTSFLSMATTKMRLIANKMTTRTAYGPGELQDAIGFVNVVDFPVLKLLSVASSLNNSGLADTMINKYAELVAAKYAQAYIVEAVQGLNAGLDKRKSAGDALVASEVERIRKDASDAVREAKEKVALAYRNNTDAFNIGVELATYERAMNASLPQSLRNSLSFQRSAGGF